MQQGSPKEIYEFPNTSFVAQFVGTTNIFQGTLSFIEGVALLALEGLGKFEVSLPKSRAGIAEGSTLFMSIRPEKIDISKTPLTGFSNQLRGVVKSIVYHGRSTQYNVQLANDMIVQVFEQNEEHFPQEVIDYEDLVYLYWQKDNSVLLER